MNVPLPAGRRRGTPYQVAVVCLGNICRSPMAAVVLSDRIEAAGLGGEVEVVSAGTGGWHVGGPIDERAAVLLGSRGYDPSRHRARQFGADWFDTYDLVLAMDTRNHRDLAGLAGAGTGGRLRMFRDFDPVATRGGDSVDDLDVPDPYYGGDDGFGRVLAMVERTSEALVAAFLAARVEGEVD